MSETEEITAESEVPEIEPQGSRWAKAHHVLLFFAGGLVLLWLLTGVYKVDANQVALVERMGRFVSVQHVETEGPAARKTVEKAVLVGPGQHYHWPWPIDVVYKVDMQTKYVVVADFSAASAATEEFKKQFLRQGYPQAVLDSWYDPYLITADKNVMNAKMTVGYQIKDPEAYLMSVSHRTLEAAERGQGPESAISQMAAHVLIRTFAQKPVDWILRGEGKEKLMTELRDRMNAAVPRLDLGIAVDSVALEAGWPMQVNEAFQGVTKAVYDAETTINNARSYAQATMNQARLGDANRIRSEAEGYRQKVVQDATGEMDRFKLVYERFKAAPEVTRLSLYGDAINTVLQAVAQKIYVQKGERATLTIETPDERRTAPGGNTSRPPGGPGQ